MLIASTTVCLAASAKLDAWQDEYGWKTSDDQRDQGETSVPAVLPCCLFSPTVNWLQCCRGDNTKLLNIVSQTRTCFRSNQKFNIHHNPKKRKCVVCRRDKHRKQSQQTHNASTEALKLPVFWCFSCPLQGTLQQWWIHIFPSQLWMHFLYLEHMLQAVHEAAAGGWVTQWAIPEMTDCLPMLGLMCHDWCEAVMTVKLMFCLISGSGIIRLIVAWIRAEK